MNTAVIGAGLMGKKRADSAKACGLGIKCVYDIDESAANKLADEFGAVVLPWKECISNPEVDIVFMCTSHDALKQITIEAINNGKHVLVEKPVGRSSKEIQEIIDAQNKQEKFIAVKAGLNHRFHPMIAKAKELADQGAIGDLLYMTGEYGHGGREGMQNEWRCKKSVSGGGELLDQGSHLIDIYRLFFGYPENVNGFAPTYIWKSDDPVEDNSFMILRNSSNCTGHMHVSWTMWKNCFQFKITGTKGVIVVSGLGKSYGPETLKLYKRGAMGKAEIDEIYEGDDNSFIEELKYFLECIEKQEQPENGLNGALENIKVVEKLYEANKK